MGSQEKDNEIKPNPSQGQTTEPAKAIVPSSSEEGAKGSSISRTTESRAGNGSVPHPSEGRAKATGHRSVILSFIIKESKHILRDKRTMLILFGMPVVMMLLFGFAISTDVRDVRTVVVLSHYDQLAEKFIESLSSSEYFDITDRVGTPADAERLMRNQKADIAIVFSQNFSKHRNDGTARVQVIADAADPNMAQQYAAYVQQIFVQKAVQFMPSAMASMNRQPSPSVSTKLLYNPQMKSSYNFVPGIMGLLLMLICAMMTSISIVREKERGTMEVLLVSPVKPLVILIAKAVPYMVLAILILTAILLMSVYILDVPISGGLGWIYIVSFVYILLALSFGLLISTIAKTQLVALLMSAMMLLLPSIMLSGMMFPIESMPWILQVITYAMPPRYFISAMRKLMIMGVGFGNVLSEFSVLTGMTVFLLLIALKKFNVRLE
jgi:ABC-2 type transport system permease protein